MLENELKNLGLSEKEAKVYLAALELGNATAQEIAKKAGINRATAYFVLKQLMGLGLASETEENKKTKFVAEHPERLAVFLKKKEEEIKSSEQLFESILPKLHSIYNRSGDKPVVRYYEGMDSPRHLRGDILRKIKNDKLYIFFNRDLIKGIFTPEENREFREKKLKQKITTISIYAGEPDTAVSEGIEKVHLNDNRVRADISIYGDTVKIAKVYAKDKIGIITIEDKETADTLKSLFETAYNGLKKKGA